MKIFYVKNLGYMPGDHAWAFPDTIAPNSGYIPGSHAWGLPSAIANRQQAALAAQQTKEQRILQRNEAEFLRQKKKTIVKAGREQMKKIAASRLLSYRFSQHCR